jgi:hypothetical protein
MPEAFPPNGCDDIPVEAIEWPDSEDLVDCVVPEPPPPIYDCSPPPFPLPLPASYTVDADSSSSLV